MPNLQHSPPEKTSAKEEAAEAVEQESLQSPETASAMANPKETEAEDVKTQLNITELLLKKGNTLGHDQEEIDVLDLIDLVVKYLINPEDKLKAQEIANRAESLQASLGTTYLRELFKFMDLSVKYEKDRKIWKNSLIEPKMKGLKEILALVDVEKIAESLYLVVEEIQSQRLYEQSLGAKKKLQETPVPPYHKSEFKTVVNTPPIHSKAKLLESEESDGASSIGEKIKPFKEEEDPLPGLTFKQRAKYEPTYEHYREVASKMSHPRMNFDDLVKGLKRDFQNPSASREDRVSKNMNKMEDAYDLLRDMRLESIRDFSAWTIDQDVYLDEMAAIVLSLKELYQHHFGKKKNQDSIESLRNLPCPDCASGAQFTFEELLVHQQTFHPQLRVEVSPQQNLNQMPLPKPLDH